MLSAPQERDLFAERRDRLRLAGYVPAATLSAVNAPATTARRDEWWNRSFVSGEYAEDTKAYPQMPDDYTPARSLGLAMTGHRRTHRMRYRNGDIDVRMPSATSIKRYSTENGNPTFDVPVSVSIKGGPPKQGWVRVTKTGPQSWTTTPQGGGTGPESEMLGEAVSAVLESRRPSTALSSVGDLLERRAQRASEAGSQMVPVKSSFIEEVGYDDSTGTMGTQIGDKVYGHAVSRQYFERVQASRRPGAMFNHLVKKGQRAGVQRCPKCARFYSESISHTCPASHKSAEGIGLDHLGRARDRAKLVAEVRSRTSADEPAVTPAPAQKPAEPATVTPAPEPEPVPATAPVLPDRSHLEEPIVSMRQFEQEMSSLQDGARGHKFEITANGVDRFCESSAQAPGYFTHIRVGTDGSLHRYVNAEPVEAFAKDQTKAAALEAWTLENRAEMARVTDAERRRRGPVRQVPENGPF